MNRENAYINPNRTNIIKRGVAWGNERKCDANGVSMKSKILISLASHPEGLTILELSSLLGSHRHTIVKYLFELKGAGKIIQRPVGSAVLHYLATEQTMKALGLDGTDDSTDSPHPLTDISKRRKIDA